MIWLKRNAVSLIYLTLAGALSGYLVGASVGAEENGLTLGAFWYGPGVCFGLTTAWLLRRRLPWGMGGRLLWAAISTLAWNVAIRLYMAGGIASNGISAPALAISGAAGGLVLSIGYCALTGQLRQWRRIGLTTLAGAVLGLAMEPALLLESVQWLNFMLAFTIWQVGLGLGLLAYGENNTKAK